VVENDDICLYVFDFHLLVSGYKTHVGYFHTFNLQRQDVNYQASLIN
jgi:hypothetical protein